MFIILEEQLRRFNLDKRQLEIVEWLIKQAQPSSTPIEVIQKLESIAPSMYKDAYGKMFVDEKKAVQLAFTYYVTKKYYPNKKRNKFCFFLKE